MQSPLVILMDDICFHSNTIGLASNSWKDKVLWNLKDLSKECMVRLFLQIFPAINVPASQGGYSYCVFESSSSTIHGHFLPFNFAPFYHIFIVEAMVLPKFMFQVFNYHGLQKIKDNGKKNVMRTTGHQSPPTRRISSLFPFFPHDRCSVITGHHLQEGLTPPPPCRIHLSTALPQIKKLLGHIVILSFLKNILSGMEATGLVDPPLLRHCVEIFESYGQFSSLK